MKINYYRGVVLVVKPALLMLSLSIALLIPQESGFCQQPKYYIDNGSFLQVGYNDPHTVEAVRWEVRLYKNGKPTGGNDHWGLISGVSPEDVMEKLKSSQQNEIAWSKFFGTDYREEEFTHFNFLGPIAKIRLNDNENSSAKRIDNAVSRLNEMKTLYQRIRQILSDEPKAKNPYANVGKVLKEYLENIKDAEKRLTQLRGILSKADEQGMETIIANTEGFLNKNLESAETNAKKLKKAMGEKEPGGKVFNIDFSYRYDKPGSDEYTEEMIIQWGYVEGRNLIIESKTHTWSNIGRQDEIDWHVISDINMKQTVPVNSINTSEIQSFYDEGRWIIKVISNDPEGVHSVYTSTKNSVDLGTFDHLNNVLLLYCRNEQDVQEIIKLLKKVLR